VNAIVTGGLQGIGFEIAKALRQRGDNVFVFDYVSYENPQILNLKALDIHYIQVDVSQAESVKNGFEKFSEHMGTSNSLDILVNNAGITRDNLLLRMNEQEWDAVLNVNLKGAFLCSQQAIKKMIRQKKSYIVNMSSIVALSGNAGQANYAASKAGLISLTKTISQEYAGRNVLANAITPGFIQTQMTNKLSEEIKAKALDHIPLKRFGEPSDIANLILFLTSGNADYITGQVIGVNGGMI
jgi:3-oxoacyl-[acyl-carrier protein] reductase